MPFSRVMRIQRRGSPGRICCPSSSSGCSAISACNSSSVAKGSSSRDSSPPLHLWCIYAPPCCNSNLDIPRSRPTMPRGRFPLGERTVQICAVFLAGPSGGRRRRELVGDDSPPAFVQMPPQVVPGEDIPQGVGVITQVFKPALNTGLGAGRVTVPAIDHLAPPDGDGVHQPVLADAGHQPGEVLRRHLGKYPCKVADRVLHLHIHSPPASRRPAFDTGPRGFTFTPAPVSSLVGWNGLRHPPARTMSPKSVNQIPDLSGQGLPRPETAHPAIPAHRQEYRGMPASPETLNQGLKAATGTFWPTD